MCRLNLNKTNVILCCSSVSSVINALSAVVLEDFIGPALLHFNNKKLDDKTKKYIATASGKLF